MKMSLMARFVLLVLPLILVGAIVSYITTSELNKNSEAVSNIFKLNNEASRSAFYVSEMGSGLKGFMLDPSNEQEFKRKMAADDANASAIAKMKQLTTDSRLLKLISELGELDETKLNPAENKVLELVKAGKQAEAVATYTKVYMPLRALYDELSETLTKETATTSELLLVSIEEDLKTATKHINIGMFLGLVLVAATILWATSRIVRSIKRISDSLGNSAEHTGSFSQQLSGASQQLSGEATDSAGALQESVASIEELSSMVKLNADNAREALKLAQTSQQAAEQGESEMRRLNDAMSDISTSSKKIEEIINVIDDIAFQTNLLALNAAVEAARAGEQGKGFAVVAEAVRSLAARSASAAKDITSLIKESVVKIDRGSKIADESAGALKNILGAVSKVSELNQQIASASQEQATGITQISRAMNDLDQSTQRNAASAEEVAASSEQMSAQALALQGEVENLRRLVDGRARRRDAAGVQSAAMPASMSTSTRHGSGPTRKNVVPLHRIAGKGSAIKPVNPEDVIPLGEEPTANVKTTAGF